MKLFDDMTGEPNIWEWVDLRRGKQFTVAWREGVYWHYRYTEAEQRAGALPFYRFERIKQAPALLSLEEAQQRAISLYGYAKHNIYDKFEMRFENYSLCNKAGDIYNALQKHRSAAKETILEARIHWMILHDGTTSRWDWEDGIEPLALPEPSKLKNGTQVVFHPKKLNILRSYQEILAKMPAVFPLEVYSVSELRYRERRLQTKGIAFLPQPIALFKTPATWRNWAGAKLEAS